MNISNLLVTMVQNIQKVYDAGKSISTDYNSGYDSGYSNGWNQGYTVGFTKGADSVVDKVSYAKKMNSVFQDVVFPENFEFECTFKNVVDCNYMLNLARNLKKVKLAHDNPDTAVSCSNLFMSKAAYTSTLEEVDLTDFAYNITLRQNMFGYQKALKRILGEMDFSSTTNVTNMFIQCTALEEVYFKPETLSLSISFAQSSLLNADCVQSIIDGLATVETAQTLTLHSTVLSALTEDQISQINHKNWSVA